MRFRFDFFRRRTKAAEMRKFRISTQRFYTVQSAADIERLLHGGEPWPTDLDRANLGEGLYAWSRKSEAHIYRRCLTRDRPELHLFVVPVRISIADLETLSTLDLTKLPDDAVNRWLEQYTQYGEAKPHRYDYFVRGVGIGGEEHYFA